MVDDGWRVVDLEESIMLLGVYGGWWVAGGRFRRKFRFVTGVWWMVSGDFEERFILLGEAGGWSMVGGFC